jgi:sterol desaturase/sphingolipid hydroxylase (fatty acid hydroxylase superfamily)
MKYPVLAILILSYMQYYSSASEFSTTATTTTTTTLPPSSSPISPKGLFMGLLSVAAVQLFVTLPYYYMLRHNIIHRPFVQVKRSTTQKPFWSGLVSHLSRLEGFVLLGSYLSLTWMFGLMPPSYYNLERHMFEWDTAIDVLLQLMLNDLYQTLAHLLEHQIAKIYKKAHKPHHKFTSPELFDAFDGHYMDTICMILVPLFTTCHTLATFRSVSVWSYIVFGATYANYLCLIHSEYEHVWDRCFHKIGIATAADHHVHHRLFNQNFGHLFTYWDRMFGTYTSPSEYPKYFVGSSNKNKNKKK